MSTKALGRRYETTALSCMDAADSAIETVAVRTAQGSRPRFVYNVIGAARKGSHILYDFAGTARAHRALFAVPRPFAVWAHGLEVWDRPRPDYLKALARADLVLVNSGYNLERAANVLAGMRHVALCELATGANDPPAVVGPSEGCPTVMLLGRVDRMLAKGHDLLVAIWPQVIAAVPDARLLFVGGGDALGLLRDHAARSPAARSIDIAGFVQDDALDALWRRATIMAMPGYAEGFGLVYIEAMRHGIPVIASREDAGQAINIDGVTGFNRSRAKPDAIGEVIIQLLRDHDLCRRMGEAGHDLWRARYRFAHFEARLQTATAAFLGG